MKNNIVFIAGGIWQKPFVKYLKEKNHHLTVVNPVETESTELADYHLKCDINNLTEIEKYIEKTNPIFITSDQSDVSTEIVTKLSEKYRLPCNRMDVIEKFTNKYEIYKFASLINIKVPNTKIISSIEDLLSFGESQKYPIVIKPVDSTMSRGFRKINSPNEINKEIIESCLKFSKSKQIIAQNFIQGDMITLEGVCSNGKHKTLAVSRKINEEYFKPGITSSVAYPANYPEDLLNNVIETNDRYVEESGMKFGLTHSEYIVDNDFCLIEIGARGGGAGITDRIVPWVSGVNSYDILYKSLMGENVDVKSINPLKKSALLRYYRKEDVTEEQAREIQKIPEVSVFCYNFTKTQYVADANDCRFTMGIYLTENEIEMKNLKEKIAKILE